jgi:hypothetical protein
MSDEEVKIIIQLYFDGELEKSSEPVLFTILAENSSGREYFKELNLIHTAAQQNIEEFPAELEERIFRTIESKEKSQQSFFRGNIFLSAASLSIAVLLLILSSFLFFELRDYRSRIEMVSEQVRMQNQTIELILNNSLPPAEVRTGRVNEIIVNANL